VPILQHAEQMSFAKIEQELKRAASAAREGKLSIHDLSGGTFTITNGGVFGSLLSTPILNPPQSSILGMHAIQERPIAIKGEVQIRSMMYVALTYDHRLIDGSDAVSFLVHLKQLLEDPLQMILEI
jgi:2-oxoglutarate dehydrogenase E2 component (dihydrolipoamide succinyltransferase)